MKKTALTFFLLAASHASACSVCFQGGNSRTAYLATTGALASLPFLMIGGIIFFVRRHLKQSQSADPAESGGSV